MNRIEPRRLIANYRKANKKPIRGEYVNKSGDGCCAMGVTAVCELRPKGMHVDRYNIGFMAKDGLGFTEDYFRGFVCGWDDDANPGGVGCGSDFDLGLSDGRSCWDAVCDEGMVCE